MKNLDPKRARWIRLRMGILCGVMGLGTGGVLSAAYRVQVEDGATWRDAAEKQRQRRLHVDPKRGTIFDRNGTALAVSVEVPSVSADVLEMLRAVEGKAAQEAVLKDAAVRVGQALSLDPQELYARLATRHRFVWIKRRIGSDETALIKDLTDLRKPHPIRGLTIEGEGHRYYPARELAGPVLGFVAPDGQGKDGLELALDEELRGHVEELKGLRDRSGRLIFSEGTTDEQALQGHDVQLAIDEGIQHVAERELDAAQKTYETKGASIVVVDPGTGEILAIASSPGYNPNDYGESEVESRRDRAVTDRFEPGSAMKAFTVAAALAAGSLKPTEQIYCERGTFQLANNVIIHDTHVNEWLTPTRILAISSNIGALKIGLGLGESGLYAAFRRFGFGEPTGLPLPGEAAGVLRPKGRPWYDVETANASFGQGISVTTVQLAMAMSAIANGGKLLEPILVKRVTDSRGRSVKDYGTHVRREVVPSGVAHMVADMLTAVTELGGTGHEAAVPGFRVAGKTATAQKTDPATGKYSADLYTASFVGFIPAEKPRLVIAIVLDEPMIGHYGGDLAGPVFRRVAEASLRYLGVTPSTTSPKLKDVTREGDPADTTIVAMRPPIELDPAFAGDAGVPAPAGPLPAGDVRVPDATGLGAHDAVIVLSKAGLLPQLEGTGHIVRMLPGAGVAVPKGSSVRLVLEQGS